MQANKLAIAAVVLAPLLGATPAAAHCDSLGGPVVTAARNALAAGDPDLVLLWVQPGDEAEIRAAFDRTLHVRKLSPEAQQLADLAFFETLVRIHRRGEGAPYEGLRPEGAAIDPGIEKADSAVEAGSIDEMASELGREVERSVKERFADLQRRKGYPKADLAAGRAWVAAYVTFIHHVEGIVKAVHGPEHGHATPAPPETEPRHAH